MIKAGIFDAGGVLITNEISFVYADIVKTLGITQKSLENGLDHLLGPFLKGEVTDKEFWRSFVDYTKAPGKLPQESLYIREYRKRYKKNEDILSLAVRLKAMGYKLAILSDTITPHADFNRKMGLYDNFDVEVLSNKVGLVKPDPEIFRYTLKKLNVAPEEAFFVDDLEINVNAANSLGIHGIKYVGFELLKKDLKKLGVKF